MAQIETRVNVPRGGIFNQIASWFKNLFSTVRQFNLFNIGVREVMPDIDAVNAVERGFNASAAIYSIIMRDADKFASIPRSLVDPKKVEEKRAKVPFKLKHLIKAIRPATGFKSQNALEVLLNRPNPYQGQAAFFKVTRAYYSLCGESFIWCNRGDVSDQTDLQQDLLPILEMYPLPAHLVEIVPDPENMWGVLGYILKANGQSIPMRKNDVIHWKNVNLEFDLSTKIHLHGMTPLKPGRNDLQQNIDGTRTAVRMYQNDGAKGVIFNETFDSATPEQETQIRSVINSKINNNDVKGAIAALQGKWGYLDMSTSSIDMQLLDGIKMSWQVLCFLLGVPYELFDSAVTYANKAEAKKGWVSDKIIPACTELDDELNRVLLRPFGLEGKAIIQCDYSQLAELQEDMAKLVEWLLKAYWLSPNEKREIQGYEARPEPEMDEPWMPNNLAPISNMQGDGFDTLMNDLGVADYAVPEPDTTDEPPPPDPKKNGKHKKEFVI